MLYSTSVALFESTDASSVLNDPVNQDWLALVDAIDGDIFEDVERRYYLALNHYRSLDSSPPVAGQRQIMAQNKQEALQQALELIEDRKRTPKVAASNQEEAIFVECVPSQQDVPEALSDFTTPAPPLALLLGGAGRPPCDAQCLMRAFLGAQLLIGSDAVTDVHRLLHSNPTFARACGFRGANARKQPGELTSRRLPSASTCREFNEVMCRYGLWHLCRIEKVASNLSEGVVDIEQTLVFDTTHLEANSHCASVVPNDAEPEEGKKPKQRKVCRVQKMCSCGKDHWEECEHAWVATDQGAAVVVKGFSRIYWAHKASVVGFADSEIPIDIRVLQYAAEHDGKTLLPHLEVLQRAFPGVVADLECVLADDAYRGNQEEVAQFGQDARLVVPVHPSRRSTAEIAEGLAGIDRFTPIGVPVCDGDHRFEMVGRDIAGQRYIWTAPSDEDGESVCQTCPFAASCLSKGKRRHIRVDRDDFPQIDWEHPQHLSRNKKRFDRRPGIERAIKRIKVDLAAEDLSVRDSLRVQAHLDRRLLVLHILLAVSSP